MASGRVSTNQFATAKWIVDTNGLSAGATHSTIASALTDAASGETIAIKPGTYTENLTLKAGVNLVAWVGDGFTPTVTIAGTLTASFTGSCSISGMRLQTNGANVLATTGANATVIDVTDVYFNLTDFSGISHASTNTSSVIRLFTCKGNLGTTNIKFFDVTNANLAITHCLIGNSGLSTLASTMAGLELQIQNSDLSFPITTSGANAQTRIEASGILCNGINTTAINANSTQAIGTRIFDSLIQSGTATPITIGAGATLRVASITLYHSNATAISGAGTLVYGTIEQLDTVGAISSAVSAKAVKAGSLNLSAGGATVDEFSTDGAMAGNSDTAVPTEQAVVEYTDFNRTNPGFSNLGINYNAGTGTFTIRGANGSNLSSTNPAYVTLPSKATPGNYTKYTITANQDFIDDNGSSEIIGALFGLTTGVAYASDVLFFIYAVTDDAEGAIAFMISRIPHRQASPASANIGTPAGPTAASTQGSFFSFDSVTTTSYDANPCLCIGSFRMRMSASNDWTVQTLTTSDGIGKFNSSTALTLLTGTFGAATGTYIKANTGTAPVFTTNSWTYFIQQDGWAYCEFFMTGDGGTDGVGAVVAHMATPLIPAQTNAVADNIAAFIYGATSTIGYTVYSGTAPTGFQFVNTTLTTLNNADFVNGNRTLRGHIYFLISTT